MSEYRKQWKEREQREGALVSQTKVSFVDSKVKPK